MTQQAAALQAYNNELVKCFEDLYTKQDELNRQIRLEEDEKEHLMHDIGILSVKLSKINLSMAQILTIRADLDETIAEKEAAYAKIVGSSQSLLNILKKVTLEAAEIIGKVETEEEAEIAESAETAKTTETVGTAEKVENLGESPVE